MTNAIEIVLDEEVQKIFDHFAAGFGVAIMFFSPDGQVLKRGLNRANSCFCNIIQDKIFGRNICYVLDESKRRECTERQQPISYRCHAGIEEAVAPIYLEKQLAGFAMIGQFRSTEKISPAVLRKCPVKFRKRLEKAFFELPYFEPERVKDILGLFEDFVPKHTKQYGNLAAEIRRMIGEFRDDVDNGTFPAPENSWS